MNLPILLFNCKKHKFILNKNSGDGNNEKNDRRRAPPASAFYYSGMEEKCGGSQSKFERKNQTPEYKAMLKRLKEENAKHGIIIPGEIL